MRATHRPPPPTRRRWLSFVPPPSTHCLKGRRKSLPENKTTGPWVSLLEAFREIRLRNRGASPRSGVLIPSWGSPRGLPAPESIRQFASLRSRAILFWQYSFPQEGVRGRSVIDCLLSPKQATGGGEGAHSIDSSWQTLHNIRHRPHGGLRGFFVSCWYKLPEEPCLAMFVVL